jgi:hypothetical protein
MNRDFERRNALSIFSGTSILLLLLSFSLSVMAQNTIEEKVNRLEQIKSIIPQTSSAYIGVSLNRGLIHFDSENSFRATLESLEEQSEQYNDAWLDAHAELTEEELETLEEQIGFSEDQVYIDFENSFGHASLRAEIEARVEVWLDTQEPDWENSPEDHFILDQGMRTIMTPDAAFMIGTSIYLAADEGITYEITDGDFNTLDLLIANMLDPYTASNVVVYGADDDSVKTKTAMGCKWWASKNNYVVYSGGSRRFKATSRWRGWPWFARASAKTTSYKRKNGKWKRHRTWLEAYVAGSASGDQCETSSPFSYKYKKKKRRCLKATRTIWGVGLTLRIGCNYIGTFHSASGVGYTQYLL